MSKKQTLEELAQSIQYLINVGVRNRSKEDREYKDKYDEVVYEIKDQIRHAKTVVEDYKDRGLTFNTIEAEGYLRACLTIGEILGIEEREE